MMFSVFPNMLWGQPVDSAVSNKTPNPLILSHALCVFDLIYQVTMAERSAADRACKDPNPIIDGRKANVNLAYLGAKPRVMQPGKETNVDQHWPVLKINNGVQTWQNMVVWLRVWGWLCLHKQTRKSNHSLIFTSGVTCWMCKEVLCELLPVHIAQQLNLLFYSVFSSFLFCFVPPRFYLWRSPDSPCVHPEALWVSTNESTCGLEDVRMCTFLL